MKVLIAAAVIVGSVVLLNARPEVTTDAAKAKDAVVRLAERVPPRLERAGHRFAECAGDKLERVGARIERIGERIGNRLERAGRRLEQKVERLFD
jgi:hypothetical protein